MSGRGCGVVPHPSVLHACVVFGPVGVQREARPVHALGRVRDGYSRGTPEVQIAERAGVARMTVRKALGK